MQLNSLTTRETARPVRPYVIAEVGFNHNGDLKTAREIIRATAEAGADCVKFQLFRPEHLLAKSVDREVQKIFRQHQLSRADYLDLEKTGEEAGVAVAASLFDVELLHWYVSETRAPFIKLASGDITYRRLIEAAGATELPVILSTGGATQAEIGRALDWLNNPGSTYLLHCLPAYPAEETSLNLTRIGQLHEEFQLPCGFSDHSQSELAPLAAVNEGAVIWERHVTLDQDQPGPEHAFSLPVEKLAELVQKLENPAEFVPAEPNRLKQMRTVETTDPKSRWAEYRQQARRSLAADRPLEAGTTLSADHFRELRPATGLEPARIYDYQDRELAESRGEREIIRAAHLR